MRGTLKLAHASSYSNVLVLVPIGISWLNSLMLWWLLYGDFQTASFFFYFLSIGIVLQWKPFSSFHLFTYNRMDLWISLLFISYNLLLYLFWYLNCPRFRWKGPLWAGSCDFLMYSHYSLASLFSGTKRGPSITLYFPWSSPRLSYFSKRSWLPSVAQGV